jgi:ankyrin repeat protein
VTEIVLGANPNSTHIKTGKSALSIAISKRDYLLARLLMSEGANPNLANQSGTTPINIARQQEFYEILKLMQE